GLSVFFRLPGQPPRRLIALKTRVLAQRRVGGRANLGGIGRFLVVRSTGYSRPQIDPLSRMLIDQHEVLVRRRFLLAAVRLLLLLGDADEKQLVFHLEQNAFGTAAALAVAHLAFPGLVWRIEYGIGRSKGRQHTRKLVVCQSGRGEELSRSVL